MDGDFFCTTCGSIALPSDETDDKAGDWCLRCGTTVVVWREIKEA